MKGEHHQEEQGVFIHEMLEEELWYPTPLLLVLYLLLVFVYYHGFSIANTLAIFQETGGWEVPEAVLEYARRSQTWTPTYTYSNFGIATLWMSVIWASTAIKEDMVYEGLGNHKDDGTLFFMGNCLFWMFFQFLWRDNPMIYVSPSLTTGKGILLSKTIYQGIEFLYYSITVILVCYRGIMKKSILRLPELSQKMLIFVCGFAPFILLKLCELAYYKNSLNLDSYLFFIGIYAFGFILLTLEKAWKNP